MDNKNDRRAELAFKLMFVPVATLAIGVVATNTATGWDSIAFFFMMLLVSGVACMAPVVLGVLALKGGTNRKEKALAAAMVPPIALFLYFVSFGGHAS